MYPCWWDELSCMWCWTVWTIRGFNRYQYSIIALKIAVYTYCPFSPGGRCALHKVFKRSSFVSCSFKCIQHILYVHIIQGFMLERNMLFPFRIVCGVCIRVYTGVHYIPLLNGNSSKRCDHLWTRVYAITPPSTPDQHYILCQRCQHTWLFNRPQINQKCVTDYHTKIGIMRLSIPVFRGVCPHLLKEKTLHSRENTH